MNSDDLKSTKPNTFLIRSLNGMGINKNDAPAGVNVAIDGAVYLGGVSKHTAVSCTDTHAGTIEAKNGCYYFCDGKFRQLASLSFMGDDVAAHCDGGGSLAVSQVCDLDGVKLRVGDTIQAYTVAKHSNCESQKTTITCQPDGTFGGATKYHLNCLPCGGGSC